MTAVSSTNVPPERPISLLLFGILNIVWGAMGLCGSACGGLMLFVPVGSGQPNPILDIMQSSAGAQAYMIGSSILGGIASVVLIVAGIGLLNSRNWARIVTLAYAVYGVLSTVAGAIASYFLFVAPLMETADPSTPEGFGAVMGAIGSGVGTCLGLLYPVFIFIFLTRPNVRAWCRRGAGDDKVTG